MRRTSLNRSPDWTGPTDVAWYLLNRRESSGTNLSVAVQRFEPGGSFVDHAHDLEQYFYVTLGEFELTIGGKAEHYKAGDFVFVDRNESHGGRNLSDGPAELIVIDYWPADSDNTVGL